MKANVLVITNRTAASPDLLASLTELAERRATRFELLVPPTEPGPVGRAGARRNLNIALRALREAGLDADGVVGTDSEPVIAAIEAFDPARHDEIVVATLPASLSHWLRCDVEARIARATGALVHHVVAREARAAPRVIHLEPERRPLSMLTPLAVLSYGRRGG